ncbi:MAG: rod shape-determining protein MreD [Cyanobacteriota bacterium]|nr:rod shape-determining protein MreD [Cyanobacteriota bacterium]
MRLLTRQPVFAASLLLVPLVGLAAPSWLTLAGVPPCWPVLWLLPWALVDGRRSALLLALVLGLLMDSQHPGLVSWIPGLLLLARWWGPLCARRPAIERPLSLGLLALGGTAMLNLTLMLQWLAWGWRFPLDRADHPAPDPGLLAQAGWTWQDLTTAGPHLLVAQTLLTALLAPLVCSLLLLLWKRADPDWRG